MNHDQQQNHGSDNADSRTLEHLRRLSRLLDSAIPLPGGFRIGLDGILGLIPGIGDALGASLSTYIVIQAARLGASPLQLSRMILNILLETLLGAVPVLGDLFDIAWKANERNMALLDAQPPRTPVRGSARQRLTVTSVVMIIVFVTVLVLLIVLALKLLLELAAVLGA